MAVGGLGCNVVLVVVCVVWGCVACACVMPGGVGGMLGCGYLDRMRLTVTFVLPYNTLFRFMDGRTVISHATASVERRAVTKYSRMMPGHYLAFTSRNWFTREY